jgi:hypothetical protein
MAAMGAFMYKIKDKFYSQQPECIAIISKKRICINIWSTSYFNILHRKVAR